MKDGSPPLDGNSGVVSGICTQKSGVNTRSLLVKSAGEGNTCILFIYWPLLANKSSFFGENGLFVVRML